MQYYYFICGLPVITIDDAKLPFSLEDFRQDAKDHLSAKDLKLMELVHLPDELERLLKLVYKLDIPPESLSVYPEGWWEQYIELHRQKLGNPQLKLSKCFGKLPDFISLELSQLLSSEELPDYYQADQKLLNACFKWLKDVPNKFLKQWFDHEAQIRNILMAINGRAHSHEYARYLIGEGELVDKLSRSNSADFGLSKQSELFDELYRAYEQNNILYREKAYDVIRWKWVDNHTFFEYFSIDKILGYYCKLKLLARWASFETNAGKESFHDALDKMEASFQIPVEFTVR
ncbi:MAG TPA: DUF2764 family protein [Candidatus Cloacimonadota bacterium]|nr:DUF2764 family protein [Candidatus Cloacimonadota bacterium]